MNVVYNAPSPIPWYKKPSVDQCSSLSVGVIYLVPLRVYQLVPAGDEAFLLVSSRAHSRRACVALTRTPCVYVPLSVYYTRDNTGNLTRAGVIKIKGWLISTAI